MTSEAGRVDPTEELGMLSLETVMVLPVIALIVLGLLQVAAVGRDLLVLHEAARVGARVAATTSGTSTPERAVRAAAPELSELEVAVVPASRRSGDLVVVEVRAVRRIGPVSHGLRASAVAQVEPIVGG
jgi:Flp pilus assembly protein TadG